MNMSLDAVLFKLVELKIIKLELNPYFYSHPSRIISKMGELKLLEFTDQLKDVTHQSKSTVLHVILDRRARIFLEGFGRKRTFGNIWEQKGRFFLKG